MLARPARGTNEMSHHEGPLASTAYRRRWSIGATKQKFGDVSWIYQRQSAASGTSVDASEWEADEADHKPLGGSFAARFAYFCTTFYGASKRSRDEKKDQTYLISQEFEP